MDLLSIAGIILAISAIGFAHLLEDGSLLHLVNLPAFLVVIGGTLGAVMLQSPWPTFKRFCRILPWIFWPPKYSEEACIEKIVMLSTEARKRGLLVLEDLVEQEQDLFIKRAALFIADAYTIDELRNVLNIELETEEQRDLDAAKIFDSMGGYSPTIGILGTVLALIKVMGDLSDPTQVGAGIAVAFVATIYGVGFANLLFIPIAQKLKFNINARSRIRELLIEGFIGIAEGENPQMLKAKLRGYLSVNP